MPKAQGQRFPQAGRSLEGEAENRAELAKIREGFARLRLPIFRRLGWLEAAGRTAAVGIAGRPPSP